MKKSHWTAIGATIALFAILYWGLERVPVEVQQAEKTRAVDFQRVNPEALEREALQGVTPDQKEYVFGLKSIIQNSQQDSLRVGMFKDLSAFWFGQDQRLIAGHYAQKAATIEDKSQSWGIAGTTYVLCTQKYKDELGTYCREQAVECFDNAISLEPDNLDFKLNKALALVELPPEDNPMMGVQQLLTLSRENPEYVPGLLQLAKLGMRTGQWEKAKGRLENILKMEPNQPLANCMLVEVLSNTNASQEAIEAQSKKCKYLKNNEK